MYSVPAQALAQAFRQGSHPAHSAYFGSLRTVADMRLDDIREMIAARTIIRAWHRRRKRRREAAAASSAAAPPRMDVEWPNRTPHSAALGPAFAALARSEAARQLDDAQQRTLGPPPGAPPPSAVVWCSDDAPPQPAASERRWRTAREVVEAAGRAGIDPAALSRAASNAAEAENRADRAVTGGDAAAALPYARGHTRSLAAHWAPRSTVSSAWRTDTGPTGGCHAVLDPDVHAAMARRVHRDVFALSAGPRSRRRRALPPPPAAAAAPSSSAALPLDAVTGGGGSSDAALMRAVLLGLRDRVTTRVCRAQAVKYTQGLAAAATARHGSSGEGGRRDEAPSSAPPAERASARRSDSADPPLPAPSSDALQAQAARRELARTQVSLLRDLQRAKQGPGHRGAGTMTAPAPAPSHEEVAFVPVLLAPWASDQHGQQQKPV